MNLVILSSILLLLGITNSNLYSQSSEWDLILGDGIPVQSMDINPKSGGRVLYAGLGSLVGTDSLLFRSNDFGKSWEKIQTPTEYISQVMCFEQDTSILFIVSGKGLYRSSNRGLEWVKKLDGSQRFGKTLQYHSPLKKLFYAQDVGKPLYVSTDLGNTWQPTFTIPASPSYCGFTISQHEEPSFLLGTYEATVSLSTDFGKTWDMVVDPDKLAVGGSETPQIAYSSHSLDFAYACMYRSVVRDLMRTSDKGQTWEKIKVDSAFGNLWSVCIDQSYHAVQNGIPQHFWVGCYPPKKAPFNIPDIEETFDGGKSWKSLRLPQKGYVIGLIYDTTTQRLYSFGSNKIWMHTLTNSVRLDNLEDYRFHITENPSHNGSVQITWDASFQARQIQITDLLGKKVMDVPSFRRDETEFECRLPKGVYFVRLYGNKEVLMMKAFVSK